MDSSASIESRFRNGNEDGLMMFSLSDISGASNGIPPASRIPTLTSSARARRLRLHGLMSDQVFRMPITGRSIRSSRLQPTADKVERCTKPGRSSLRNQRALRSGRLCLVLLSLMKSPWRGKILIGHLQTSTRPTHSDQASQSPGRSEVTVLTQRPTRPASPPISAI